MEKNINEILKKIYIPPKDSHKGQNGKLLIIGGSHLFHAASIWALEIASKIVDLVHYSSVDENNKIVQSIKREFRNGIVIRRSHIEDYIVEDDCILIGPGMVRVQGTRYRVQGLEVNSLKDIEKIKDEGEQTYYLTKYLLTKYPDKKWVIDAGALQMMELEWIPKDTILTPHHKEFENLEFRIKNSELKRKMKSLELKEKVKLLASKFNCTVLLKGKHDYVVSKDKFIEITGGNAGMTKGGTGDVLAGLTAAFYCKNDAFVSAAAASYINKRAGDDLFKTKGYWFNASDLVNQIPQTVKKLV